MNLLISTTRMWNTGDEVIYLGVKNLLEDHFGLFTPVLWNRNPGIKPMRGGFDNSFDAARHSSAVFDRFVSAGGPEWMGPRVDDVYRSILKTGTRCVHLGIGLGDHQVVVDERTREIFSSASDLVTCRDQKTYRVLEDVVPQDRLFLLPCPSLFSFIDQYKPRTTSKVKVVGLNFQGAGMDFNNVKKETFRLCLDAFRAVEKNYEVRVICNYIDDFHEAVEYFDPSIVRFSADVGDFTRFFDEVDVVVGTRVHGCMGAISSGTPGFLMDSEDDVRRRGVREVMEVLDTSPMDPDGLLGLLATVNPSDLSRRNAEYAKRVRDRYEACLKTCVPRESAVLPEVRSELSGSDRKPRFGERLSRGALRAEMILDKLGRRF